MLNQNGQVHNSNGTNGHFLNGASDYEPRPVIDVTPNTPRPKWRDAFPTFTHNMSWQDAEGCLHSMTIRSDDLTDLMSDLRLLKGMVRQAKKQAAESTQANTPTVEPDSDIPPCPVHGTPMVRKVSRRTGGIYWSHKTVTGELCFGRQKKS
jgi:hypothetical protein